MEAMGDFIDDYENGKQSGRYIHGALPRLDFEDKAFDLALCSHYLFLYSEHISLKDHIESIKELSRVATEARIYPLLSLNGEISPYLNAVMAELAKDNLTTSLVDVEYQFQKGATRMLVVQST
jgi:ubiquinone/menaquinone biosynthesis C-methylase UbiE